jgi:hypothetical protein
VARVLRCEPLTKEDVAEVAAAVGAFDLDPEAVSGRRLMAPGTSSSKAGQPQWASNLSLER